MTLRCAILDDYQNVALKMADWSPLTGKVEITVFLCDLARDELLFHALAGRIELHTVQLHRGISYAFLVFVNAFTVKSSIINLLRIALASRCTSSGSTWTTSSVSGDRASALPAARRTPPAGRRPGRREP